MILYQHLHSINSRVNREMIMLYKHALLLHKIYSKKESSKDWIDINFNQVCTSRQLNFIIIGHQNLKIVNNIQSSRLKILNRTSNDIIAGNGRILKDYMFIVWLYLLKNIRINTCKTQGKLHWKSKIPLQEIGMATIPKIYLSWLNLGMDSFKNKMSTIVIQKLSRNDYLLILQQNEIQDGWNSSKHLIVELSSVKGNQVNTVNSLSLFLREIFRQSPAIYPRQPRHQIEN